MFAVYSGDGTSEGSRKGIQAFLTDAGFEWRGVLPNDLTPEGLKDIRGIFWPGGWAWPYVRDIAPEGKQAIRDLVARGGVYIGICAGAFFASDMIRWEGRLVEYDLDLFEGVADGPIDEVEPWRGGRLTELELLDHPINAGENRQTGLYWGGPAFRLSKRQPATILSRFVKTGDPSAVTFQYGRGQVLLSSCHLEMGYEPESARQDLTGNFGAQWPWLKRAVDWTLEQGQNR